MSVLKGVTDDRLLNRYLAVVGATFAVAFIGGTIARLGIPQKLMNPVIDFGLFVCGHPVAIAALAANMIVGQPDDMAMQSDTA